MNSTFHSILFIEFPIKQTIGKILRTVFTMAPRHICAQQNYSIPRRFRDVWFFHTECNARIHGMNCNLACVGKQFLYTLNFMLPDNAPCVKCVDKYMWIRTTNMHEHRDHNLLNICGVVCVVTLPFWHFCWCRCFCHRTESDIFLFYYFGNFSINLAISSMFAYRACLYA